MSGSFVSGSATYFKKPITEPIRPLTMIPERTSISVLVRPIILGMASVIATAARPKPKAKACTQNSDRSKIMAVAAPTQAPAETPSRSGLTSWFLKTP